MHLEIRKIYYTYRNKEKKDQSYIHIDIRKERFAIDIEIRKERSILVFVRTLE